MNRAPGNQRRGATMLMVLAMLTVLALIALALAYSSRLEGTASGNFAQLTQAREAAATGLPYSIRLLRTRSGAPTSTLQPWFQVPQSLARALQSAPAAANTNRSGSSTRAATIGRLQDDLKTLVNAQVPVRVTDTGQVGGLPQAFFSITDLSGLVNLNTIRSERTLARTLDATLGKQRTSGASGANRAKTVFKMRGANSANTNGSNRGSASRNAEGFESVSDLTRGANGAPAAAAEQEIDALSQVFTAYSESPELFHASDGTAIPKIPLDHFTPEQLLATMQKAFPEKDPALLRQFAANVTDAADNDGIPTRLGRGDDTVLGVERGQPFITEVYPDSVTPNENGDQGQFVEIVNPWPKPIVLSGWQLRISSAGDRGSSASASGSSMSGFGGAQVANNGPANSGAANGNNPGASSGAGNSSLPRQRTNVASGISLNVVLPANGILVITDNYDKPAQNSAPGTGSFLSIFGRQADGSSHKIIQSDALNLPDKDARITLANENGDLIDFFDYGSEAPVNGKQSYQRDDPRVRVSHVAEATPFEISSSGGNSSSGAIVSGNSSSSGSARHTSSLAEAFANYPSLATDSSSASSGTPTRATNNQNTSGSALKTPLDVLLVSTAYAAKSDTSDSSSNSSTRSYTGTTTRENSSSKKAHGWQLPEVRVSAETSSSTNMDVRVADLFTSEHPTSNSHNMDHQHRSGSDTSSSLVARRRGDHGTSRSAETIFANGRININTAPKAALYAIDGMIGGSDYFADTAVQKIDEYRGRQIQAGKVPFENATDLLTLLFPNPTPDELRAFAKISDQITVDSTSFRIQSTNRAAGTNDPKRRPAVARARWTVSLDEQPYRLIDYAQTP